jgi:hypothetical protein
MLADARTDAPANERAEEEAPSATTDAASESPGAPAAANPMNTTLPVMLATKTWPSAT